MKKYAILLLTILILSCSKDATEEQFTESVVKKASQVVTYIDNTDGTFTEVVTEDEVVVKKSIVEDVPEGATIVVEPQDIQPIIEEIPELSMGTFSYSGRIPGLTGKIPTCKDGTPTTVHMDLTDAQGTNWISEKPVTELNGLYISEPDSLPIGNYQLRYVYLLSSTNDTLYAIPTQEDTEVRDYVEGDVPEDAPPIYSDWADTILPIQLTITDINTSIEGTALCVIPENLPIPGELEGGINTGRLQTIPIYITGEEDKGGYELDGVYYPRFDLCADYFTVIVDGYRTPERYTWSKFNQYHINVPVEYNYMMISTYDLDRSGNTMEQKIFGEGYPNGMYDPAVHGALIFEKCMD